MSNDPYAAPTANLENFNDAPVIQTKTMSAKGRLSVLSYLGQSMVLMLIALAIFAVLGLIAVGVAGLSPDSLASVESIDFSNPVLLVLAAIAVIAYLAIIVVSIIMLIKRIHDRNHSGWWILALYVAMVIPFVNIVAIFGFLYVVFFPGQKTGNRFGGRRPTKGWEKVLGILYLILVVGSIVAAIAMGGAAIIMGAG